MNITVEKQFLRFARDNGEAFAVFEFDHEEKNQIKLWVCQEGISSLELFSLMKYIAVNVFHVDNNCMKEAFHNYFEDKEPQEQQEEQEDLYKLCLRVGAYNALKRRGIHFIKDIPRKKKELLSIRGIGQKIAFEIHCKLQSVD